MDEEEEIQDNGINVDLKIDPPKGYGHYSEDMRNFEKEYPSQNVEYNICTDLEGNSFGLSTQHEESHVKINPEVLEKIKMYVKKNGLYSIITSHNHPNNSSFSTGDINTFINRNFAREARVCNKFYILVMQKPEDNFDSLKTEETKKTLHSKLINGNLKDELTNKKNALYKYWYKRYNNGTDLISLNAKYKDVEEYRPSVEVGWKTVESLCKEYGIPITRYENNFFDNVDNEVKSEKVDIDEEDADALNETFENSDEEYILRIDDRYDILPVLDKRDFDYQNTVLRSPYNWEDFSHFEKLQYQNEKEEFKNIAESEKRKTIIKSRPLIKRRKAKVKGAKNLVEIPSATDYSTIPMGRTYGVGGFGVAVYGNISNGSTNVPYTGERPKYTYGKHDYFTSSYPNGWPILPTKEIQSQQLATDRIPGLKNAITCTKELLPIFYNLLYDLHKSVEPMKSTSCFNYRKIRGYESRQDRWSSHASGTAIDYNHPWHPIRKANTYKPNQVAQIQKLIKKYGIQWGGNYTKRPDDMHFEIAVSPNSAKLIIQKLNLVNRMEQIKSGINVPVN
jgi:hypothetical protein